MFSVTIPARKSCSAKNVLRLTTPEEKILQTGIVLPITTALFSGIKCVLNNNREQGGAKLQNVCGITTLPWKSQRERPDEIMRWITTAGRQTVRAAPIREGENCVPDNNAEGVRRRRIVPRITTGDHSCYSQHKLPQKKFLLCDSGRRKVERIFKILEMCAG